MNHNDINSLYLAVFALFFSIATLFIVLLAIRP